MKKEVPLTIIFLCLCYCQIAFTQNVMHVAKQSEITAMRQEMEKDQIKLKEWQKKIELSSQTPEWFRISKNIVKIEISGILDPFGVAIDEMVKDLPESEAVKTKAEWLKFALKLTQLNSTDEIIRKMSDFAKSKLTEQVQKKVLDLIDTNLSKPDQIPQQYLKQLEDCKNNQWMEVLKQQEKVEKILEDWEQDVNKSEKHTFEKGQGKFLSEQIVTEATEILTTKLSGTPVPFFGSATNLMLLWDAGIRAFEFGMQLGDYISYKLEMYNLNKALGKYITCDNLLQQEKSFIELETSGEMSLISEEESKKMSKAEEEISQKAKKERIQRSEDQKIKETNKEQNRIADAASTAQVGQIMLAALGAGIVYSIVNETSGDSDSGSSGGGGSGDGGGDDGGGGNPSSVSISNIQISVVDNQTSNWGGVTIDGSFDYFISNPEYYNGFTGHFVIMLQLFHGFWPNNHTGSQISGEDEFIVSNPSGNISFSLTSGYTTATKARFHIVGEAMGNPQSVVVINSNEVDLTNSGRVTLDDDYSLKHNPVYQTVNYSTDLKISDDLNGILSIGQSKNGTKKYFLSLNSKSDNLNYSISLDRMSNSNSSFTTTTPNISIWYTNKSLLDSTFYWGARSDNIYRLSNLGNTTQKIYSNSTSLGFSSKPFNLVANLHIKPSIHLNQFINNKDYESTNIFAKFVSTYKVTKHSSAYLSLDKYYARSSYHNNFKKLSNIAEYGISYKSGNNLFNRSSYIYDFENKKIISYSNNLSIPLNNILTYHFNYNKYFGFGDFTFTQHRAQITLLSNYNLTISYNTPINSFQIQINQN